MLILFFRVPAYSISCNCRRRGARIITCVAPTKTFNLAGVQAAIMIASDSEVRAKLQQNAMAHGQMSLSPFAAAALKLLIHKVAPGYLSY